jgi:uncharacterized protein YjiS (DUF1127 family)
MTTTTIASTAGQPASRNLPGGFVRALGSVVNGIVTYFAHREAIKTLSELDDRALRDIGIERSRIEVAVRGGIDRISGASGELPRLIAMQSTGPVDRPGRFYFAWGCFALFVSGRCSRPQCRTTSTEHLA